MKRLTILGIIACVGLLVAPAAVFAPPGPPDGLDVNVASPLPLPVTVQPDGLTVNVSTVYRFEGFTDAATTGDSGGTPGMHAICRNQFGQFARLCTEEEFFKSTNIRALKSCLLHTQEKQ
jgi:hypothetical protein